jgi:hypothetical protein
VSAAVLRPLAAAAHHQGLKVWAHAAPFPERPTDVVNAGADVVSHADLLVAKLMPPTNGMPAYRILVNFTRMTLASPRCCD